MVGRLASKASLLRQQKYKNNVVIFLVFIFLIQMVIPTVNADGLDGLDICTELNNGFCDTVDSEDDGSSQVSWVEGIYHINMLDTESMLFVATWEIYEYDRTPLGFTGTLAQTALENDGIFSGDGIPADVIRNSWDEPWNGQSDSISVEDKLMEEISANIGNMLSSLGSVSTPTTNWINSFEKDSGVVNCQTDRTQDDDGNAYYPPICVQTTVEIELSADKFGLGTNSNLDLESAYKSLLIMGGQVKTSLPISIESGHKSIYHVDPPNYATIIGTNGPGATKISNSDTFPYNSGRWEVNNLNFPSGYSSNLEFTVGFRNNETTNAFNLAPNSKSINLEVVLDLSDENAASIELLAGISHIETGSIQGLELIPSDKGNIPIVTSDGIRMAHHNGLINLDAISDNFPVSSVGNSLSSTVPGLNIEMGEFEWILDSSLENSALLAGGLNFEHSLSNCETAGVNYCISGDAAMGTEYPVYLRSTSAPFKLGLSDLIGDKLGDLSFLNDVSQGDLEKIINSGMAFETILDPSFLSAMKPSGMGNTEITLKLILPNWASNKEGGNTILLSHISDNNYVGDFGLQGANSFDWAHPLCYESAGCSDISQNVFCKSIEKSCKKGLVNLDISEYSFSELQKGITVEFALNMEISLHRLSVPSSILDSMNSDTTQVSLPVLPSDLLKLILEIADRGDTPYSTSFSICDNDQIEICKNDQTIEFSTNGVTEFTNQFGESVTSLIKSELKTSSKIGDIEIDGFKINTTLGGLIDTDSVIGDEEGIVLSINIPKVRTTIGLGNSWSEIYEIINNGETDNLNIDINAPLLDNIVNPIMAPMIKAMEGLTGALTLVAASTITDGLAIKDIKTDLPNIDSLDMPIELKLTLPLGIYLEDLTSMSGRSSSSFNSEERQVIEYRMVSGTTDSINFNLIIGWQWILQQLLPYIFFTLFLISWRIRARIKKRSKKKRASEIKIIKAEASENKFARSIILNPDIEVIGISNCKISIKKRVNS
jgi:hypothetical protein